MNPKDYLGQIKVLEIKIKHMEERMEELRQQSINMVVSENGERVQSSKPSDRMAIIDKMVDMSYDIGQAILQLEEKKNTIIQEIHLLSDKTFIEILKKRYIDGESLHDIADDLVYDYKYLCKKHGYALEAFKKTVLEKQHDQSRLLM